MSNSKDEYIKSFEKLKEHAGKHGISEFRFNFKDGRAYIAPLTCGNIINLHLIGKYDYDFDAHRNHYLINGLPYYEFYLEKNEVKNYYVTLLEHILESKKYGLTIERKTKNGERLEIRSKKHWIVFHNYNKEQYRWILETTKDYALSYNTKLKEKTKTLLTNS